MLIKRVWQEIAFRPEIAMNQLITFWPEWLLSQKIAFLPEMAFRPKMVFFLPEMAFCQNWQFGRNCFSAKNTFVKFEVAFLARHGFWARNGFFQMNLPYFSKY